MPADPVQQDKDTVWTYWQALDEARTGAELAEVVHRYNHDDVAWNGPAPIDTVQGAEALLDRVWRPLRRAFPDLSRRVDIFMGGTSFGRDWVSSTGYLVGRFERDWLGIPATGRETFIRYGEFCQLREGRIATAYVGLDVVDVARQAGLDLLPGYGGAAVIAPPKPDGVLRTAQDSGESERSRALLEAMERGLNSFDGADVASAASRSTKIDGYQWYGPAPLGYCDGLNEFEDYHQVPWLRAFPDRYCGDHAALFGEGRFVCCTGWPLVVMTHTGSYMDIPATGRRLQLRCMDWFTRDGDRLVENRVWFDLIDLARQMGRDVFRQPVAEAS